MKNKVKVSDKNSPMKGMIGSIRRISKNCLFLWNQDLMYENGPQGIFSINPKSCTLQGEDLLKNVPSHFVASHGNRIKKDKLMDQTVIILTNLKEAQRGTKGRVVHMNGDMASVDITLKIGIRPTKPVVIDKKYLITME